MVYNYSWWLLLFFAVCLNLGSWSYSTLTRKFLGNIKYFKDTTPYTFDTFGI